MYSTIKGAKKCAKSLKRALDESGLSYSLQKCHAAVALAGGFRDWHDLEARLGPAARTVDPAAFQRMLLATLPEPCLSPAIAWLDDEPKMPAIDPDVPLLWYRDVLPYVLSTEVVHRSRTSLLRPGSGQGQKLRASLVLGLLVNTHGGDQVHPLLDPISLALTYKGQPHALFKSDADHPRFDEELRVLVDAGVLDVGPGIVRVLTPDAAAVIAHVRARRSSRYEHWMGAGGEMVAITLRDVLAGTGVRHARRLAGAIADWGSKAYRVPSGSVLDLMSELAEEGELETFSRAYGLLAGIRPASARTVSDAVPAKITSRYLARYRRLDAVHIQSWALANPDWPERLKTSLAQPSSFTRTVDAMAASIAAWGARSLPT